MRFTACDQPARRGVGERPRAVTGRALGDDAQPQHLLLGDRDEERRARAARRVTPMPPSSHTAGGLEQVGPLLRQPGRAHRPADLLVGHGEKEEVMLRLFAARRRAAAAP